MRKQNTSIFQKILILLGVCFLIAAASLTLLWQYGIHTWAQNTQRYVQTIRSLIPEPQGAGLEERSDHTMPLLSLDGIDFVGILEMPLQEAALPVCADWAEHQKYLSRFDGSIYDGSMQIGGTSQKGQMDFFREISVGDSVLFTDMEGNRYHYTVTDLRYAPHADQNTLQRADGELTLFVKNLFAFEYLIISCEILS